MDRNVCLLTESFAPQIDGVSNAVQNYASVILKNGNNPVVVAPKYPEADDSVFPYSVVRYTSFDMRKAVGYMAGLPFSTKVAKSLEKQKPQILHSHSPAASTFLARELRQILNIPIILTYHSKYDVDIRKAVPIKAAQNNLIKSMVENISSCDEVWAVSKGAGDSLKNIGYKGDIVVMENGVDLPLGKVSPDVINEVSVRFPSVPERRFSYGSCFLPDW